MPFRCTECGTVLPDAGVGRPCTKCGSTKIEPIQQEVYLKTWDQYPLNPYAVTLSSGSATLSSSFVIDHYPETWNRFKVWSQEEKTSTLLGNQNERVALLYSGENERLMEELATYVAQSQNRYVITAPYIYEKGTGKPIAFQPNSSESLNAFIKRFIEASGHAIILYTEQGGQIIETAFCSDMQKPTLGLVHFYRGKGHPNIGEELCPFFNNHGRLATCDCTMEKSYKGKVAGHICSDARIFCPFTQQKITKMVYDFYITGKNMYMFGADKIEDLREPITAFLVKTK
jgi:hypothetical protein